MANRNTIADVINRQNNGQPISVIQTTTGQFPFQIGGATALLTIPNPMLSVDTNGLFPNIAPVCKPFIIKLAGYKVSGGVTQIDLFWFNSATNSLTIIASTGLQSDGTQYENWFLKAELLWDPLSTNLRGTFSGFKGATAITGTTLSAAVQPATAANLQFAAGALLYTGNANEQVWLTEFSADML